MWQHWKCRFLAPRPVHTISAWFSQEEHEASNTMKHTATVVDKFTSSVWIIKQGVLVKIIFLVTKLQHNTVCPVSEQYCNIASPSLDLHQEFISPSGIASTVSLWSPSVKCRTITFTLCLNLCWFAAAANHTNIWFGSNSIRWQLCVYLLYRWNCMEHKQTPSSYTGLPD